MDVRGEQSKTDAFVHVLDGDQGVSGVERERLGGEHGEDGEERERSGHNQSGVLGPHTDGRECFLTS